MRLLVVVLALAISPLGPSVCEVVCGVHGAERETTTSATSCHGGADATGPVIEHDHDCAQSDQSLAILSVSSASTGDFMAIGPVTLAAHVAVLTIGVGSLTSYPLSPPHSPPIRSLRI